MLTIMSIISIQHHYSLHFCSIIFVTSSISLDRMEPFIELQSSCNKSTKRCVQVVKLNSQIEICFILFWKNVCTQFHRTSLVLVMHVYCVANCGHNRITSCFTSTKYTTRYLNNLSFVRISHWHTYIFFCIFYFSPFLSLSLSLSLLSLFGTTSLAHTSMCMKSFSNIWKTDQIQVPHIYDRNVTLSSNVPLVLSYVSIQKEMLLIIQMNNESQF